ncbi:hypothetical protein Tco_0464361 [Tanacetum coccineum]
MSDSEHSTVSYTSISLDSGPLALGIPLMDAGEVPEMDPYEEVAQQGHLAPPSPTYVPDPYEEVAQQADSEATREKLDTNISMPCEIEQKRGFPAFQNPNTTKVAKSMDDDVEQNPL